MEFLGLFLRHHFTGKVVVASLVSLLWTVIAMQPCNNIPCYNKANYTSPLIDESVKKDSSLVYVLKFFRKCWNFFAKSWLFFSGYHVLGICFSGFSAVIIRIINLSVMWLCNVIVKMGKKCNLSNKGILACHFCFCIFLFVFEGFNQTSSLPLLSDTWVSLSKDIEVAASRGGVGWGCVTIMQFGFT